MTVNSAIYYHPDGYDTKTKTLMGRRAAGESFLRSFVRHAKVDQVFCYCEQASHYQAFTKQLADFNLNNMATTMVAPNDFSTLSDIGCLYYPSPGISQFAWPRLRASSSYSLCGITHTTASSGALQSLSDSLIAPLENWDAIICTSRSVKKMVENLFARWQDYFKERGMASITPRCQLPVIPLGVELDQVLMGEQRLQARQHCREKLGISPEDVVFLFIGRLSYHAKANPLPMLQALEIVAKQTPVKLHLIQAGWFANDGLRDNMVNAARQIAPAVNHHFLDGRQPRLKKQILAAADIFTSLSDNIQETFGLTPIEAMAAGLPVVISDWDGYRDTVRHGVDGFLIPTRAPLPGTQSDLGELLELKQINYDFYIGASSLSVAIDPDEVALACARLVANPALRQQMATAGQIAVQEKFSWSVIIDQYQTLWQELAEIRGSSTGKSLGHPYYPDPFELFSHYPSESITLDTRITKKAKVTRHDFSERRQNPLLNYAHNLYFASDLERVFAQCLKNNSLIIEHLRKKLPDIPNNRLLRSCAWLAKAGLIELS